MLPRRLWPGGTATPDRRPREVPEVDHTRPPGRTVVHLYCTMSEYLLLWGNVLDESICFDRRFLRNFLQEKVEFGL